MTHLMPWNPREVPTLWLEHVAGQSLATVLELAATARAERVMLTGPPLPAGWLLGTAEGWEHGAHHLDHATPTGRYRQHATARQVEVRRAAEWFGEGDYSADTARNAWAVLGALVVQHFGAGAGLLGSPGATGRELWLRSCKRDRDTGHTITPPQASPEVAELIRSTGGQHRIELRRPTPPPVAMPSIREWALRKTAPGLWMMDGRLMYAACVRELGTGGTLATAAQCAELLDSARGQYARARYRVRVTIPEWWDHVGILPLWDADAEVWTYPDEPGRTFETWADAAEVHLARAQFRWAVSPFEGVIFDKGRPLDTWADRLLRAYEGAAWPGDTSAPAAAYSKLVRAGIRGMLLYSIGAWHSAGHAETTVTEGAMMRPAGDGWAPPQRTEHGTVWRRTVPLAGRAALMAHPEWSAQVWGRARARTLWSPTGDPAAPAGALMVPPDQLVSIYGDAVMTTHRPEWADDGKPGRLRVKGHLCGPVAWPSSGAQRDHLMHQAEAATAAGHPCTCQKESTR